MTDTPKARFDNSILRDVEKEREAAEKAKSDATVADPNAGAPAKESDARKKFALKQAIKKD